MSFKTFIGRTILRLKGWKMTDFDPQLKQCVCCVAPHTSIEDFFVGIPFYWAKGVPFKVLMKAEFFKNPIVAAILRSWGGVAVNRGKASGLVDTMIDVFKGNDTVHVIVCPEGTRKRVERWHKGFYNIAVGAGVPILLGYMDFEKKECGWGKVFYPTGDYNTDIQEIWDFYRGKHAKYPELFNLS